MKTEQRSLRLSRYYLTIVEELQEKNGLSFTDAIKQIITEYATIQTNGNNINRFLQKLEKNLKDINPSSGNESMLNSPEILDGLNEIGNNVRLILRALLILGSADSRTIVDIKKLFEENE